MRNTEHCSGGVAWPARDLYLADDGECPVKKAVLNVPALAKTRRIAIALRVAREVFTLNWDTCDT